MNSLPLPGPSLAAVTLPPCISTSFRTSVRPMPRPPSERAIERSPWAKRSKIAGEHLGRDADAVVPDLDDDLRPLASRREPDPAAGLGVLRGVREEVHEDLLEPHRVGLEPQSVP